MAGFLRQFPSSEPIIAAITAAELLHGVERAKDPARKAWRQSHVEKVLCSVRLQTFDLIQARCLARIWADLEARGLMIGAYDLQIAAAGIALGHEVATLNLREFQQIPGLKLVDPEPFRRP